MTAFATWLIGFIRSAIIWLWNNGIDVLQLLNDGLVTFLLTIVELFPAGTGVPAVGSAPANDTWVMMLKSLNWVFPVSTLVTVIGFIVAGYLAYLIIAPLARWAKILT